MRRRCSSCSPRSSSPRGLTEDEATQRFLTFGENRLPADRLPSAGDRLRTALGSPFLVLLGGLGVVLGVIGDVRGCATVTTVVVLSAGVRWWQRSRSDRAMRALRDFATHTATVRRVLRLAPRRSNANCRSRIWSLVMS